MILAHERPALPGYDQDLWAERLRYADSDIDRALRDFVTLRAGNLRLVRAATPEELERSMRHSERGEERQSQLIRMHAGHDIVHLRQIARIRRAIGADATESGGAQGGRMADVELGGPCCFCRKGIEHTAVDPCAVSVETEEGLTEAWFCHGRCFKERLAASPDVVPPAHS